MTLCEGDIFYVPVHLLGFHPHCQRPLRDHILDLTSRGEQRSMLRWIMIPNWFEFVSEYSEVCWSLRAVIWKISKNVLFWYQCLFGFLMVGEWRWILCLPELPIMRHWELWVRCLNDAGTGNSLGERILNLKLGKTLSSLISTLIATCLKWFKLLLSCC